MLCSALQLVIRVCKRELSNVLKEMEKKSTTHTAMRLTHPYDRKNVDQRKSVNLAGLQDRGVRYGVTAYRQHDYQQ